MDDNVDHDDDYDGSGLMLADHESIMLTKMVRNGFDYGAGDDGDNEDYDDWGR